MIPMKTSEGGRVVIPAEIRQTMDIKEGDTVLLELREAQAMVRKFVPAGVSLADELLAERHAENARDVAA